MGDSISGLLDTIDIWGWVLVAGRPVYRRTWRSIPGLHAPIRCQ